MERQNLLRTLPKVDTLVSCVKNFPQAKSLSEQIILESCRETIEKLRGKILSGEILQLPETAVISKCVLEKALSKSAYSLKPVINATGVVLHTNLGRALLSEKAAENVKKIASAYSTLEYSIENGERGSRHKHIESLLCSLTGAEAAMAVNNNAAAVMLALMTLCKGKEVVVSRGELVEIGGSFRVPEIMAMSGAVLREVGTTNKTKPSDYKSAVNENTAALLKVHTSNFKIVGFSQQVEIDELSEMGREKNIPTIYDLGSGLMQNDSRLGLNGENTVKDCIRKGADIVCFSADKLFGGPQAGIIAGKKEFVEQMKKNQFARVVRLDKLSFAALEATLQTYLDPERAVKEIPVLSFLSATKEELKKKAQKLNRMLPNDTTLFTKAVKESKGQVGGGSAPGEDLMSYVVEITPVSCAAQQIEEHLRGFETPIVTRINKDKVLIDVRTVFEADFKVLAAAFKKLCSLSGGEKVE